MADMLKEAATDQRDLRREGLETDLVVVGGGLAGTCCAITAARAGIRVVLIQDRPVLGGNASSEVRLWILGATSHMGNNNRWAREGGVVGEILVENVFRNPDGNPVLLDALLLEKVVEEPNITLLLNTAVLAAVKKNSQYIESVRGFCSQNSTLYEIASPMFCDASGDGVLGYLAGAAFRVGAESRAEFGEGLAAPQANQELLGHSIFFYSKDVGRPVRFVPPQFALQNIREIPRYRHFRAQDQGADLWWIEYGGRLDTVHDAETIKWELWKVVYGVWNHIKNSGEFPEAATMTLEWVGLVPGKRESRRFEGDYMLTQQDIVEQRQHDDAVSYGGWAIDLHPADGVYSEQPGCSQWHSKGVYQIPYRCLYSANIRNLFLAGRIISASHVAFGSTRVMATCAQTAQAVGAAAAMCGQENLVPADILQPARMKILQQSLLRHGQHLPHVPLVDPDDLARGAHVTVSSRLRLKSLPDDGPLASLSDSRAMLLPVCPGAMPSVSFILDVSRPTTVECQLRVSSRPDSFTPDIILASRRIGLLAGNHQLVRAEFPQVIDRSRYVFVCLTKNECVSVHTTETRITGIMSLVHHCNGAVATSNIQTPPADSGIDSFEFWLPQKRPAGQNLAISTDPPLDVFGPEMVTNGMSRPTNAANAWVAALDDPQPTLRLTWPQPQTIRRIELDFDVDFDNPLCSVLIRHPENIMPFCVREYRILDAYGQLLAQRRDNHHACNVICLPSPVTASHIDIQLTAPVAHVPAALFAARCYAR